METISLEELYRSYYQRLKYFALRYVADLMTASDIATDCLIGTHKRLKPDFTTTHIRQYLFKSVKNRCITALTLKERYDPWDNDFDSAHWDVYRFDKEFVTERLVNQLTPALKRVIMLDLEGLTTEEICKLLNRPRETIYRNRMRAIADLKLLNNQTQ